MKNVFLTLALALVSTVSFAATSVKLEEGDRAVSLVKKAKIVRTEMNTMTLALELHCTNRLGPVTSNIRYDQTTGKYELFLSATEIVTKKGLAAFCVQPQIKEVTLTVAPGMDKSNTVVTMPTSLDNTVEVAPAPRCTREFMPVCGMKPKYCPEGQVCVALMELKTYGNLCLMRADGAVLAYEGVCED